MSANSGRRASQGDGRWWWQGAPTALHPGSTLRFVRCGGAVGSLSRTGAKPVRLRQGCMGLGVAGVMEARAPPAPFVLRIPKPILWRPGRRAKASAHTNAPRASRLASRLANRRPRRSRATQAVQELRQAGDCQRVVVWGKLAPQARWGAAGAAQPREQGTERPGCGLGAGLLGEPRPELGPLQPQA